MPIFGCPLSFSRSPFWCALPWSAIYALVSEDGPGMVWPDDVPPEVAAQMQAAVTKQTPKRPRPKLAAKHAQIDRYAEILREHQLAPRRVRLALHLHRLVARGAERDIGLAALGILHAQSDAVDGIKPAATLFP